MKLSADVEKKQAILTSDKATIQDQRNQLEVLGAELNKEKQHLTQLATHLQVCLVAHGMLP